MVEVCGLCGPYRRAQAHCRLKTSETEMNTALCADMLTRALIYLSMCVYVAGNLI